MNQRSGETQGITASIKQSLATGNFNLEVANLQRKYPYTLEQIETAYSPASLAYPG